MNSNETFTIRTYGKSELAQLYLPKHSIYTALKLFKSWLEFNPRLRHLTKSKTKYFTPKQVRMIVEELGEPFDTE